MARRPADEMARLTARVPRGQQGFWDVIRDLRTFTISDIDQRSNVARPTVQDFVRRLERGGYVRRTGLRPVGRGSPAKVYELVADQPEAPRLRRDGSPARDTGRGIEQMWRTAKMLGRFTCRELAVHAATEVAPVSVETAKAYCRHLARAGYLVIAQPAKAGHKPGTGQQAVYRLRPDMNTGPLPPQIQRTDWVWDPNLKRVMGPEGGGGDGEDDGGGVA